MTCRAIWLLPSHILPAGALTCPICCYCWCTHMSHLLLLLLLLLLHPHVPLAATSTASASALACPTCCYCTHMSHLLLLLLLLLHSHVPPDAAAAHTCPTCCCCTHKSHLLLLHPHAPPAAADTITCLTCCYCCCCCCCYSSLTPDSSPTCLSRSGGTEERCVCAVGGWGGGMVRYGPPVGTRLCTRAYPTASVAALTHPVGCYSAMHVPQAHVLKTCPD